MVAFFIFGMRPVEAQPLEFRRGHLADQAAAVRDAVYPLVMGDHELAVPGDVYVQFYAVRSHPRGQLKGLQRIFRRVAGRAAVSEYPLHRSFPLVP